MSYTIDIGRTQHVYSQDVCSAVNQFDIDGEIIADSVAVTIASYWQSPGTDGIRFAELSSTGRVDAEDLLYAVKREMRDCSGDIGTSDADSYRWLNALKVWVESYI